MNHHVITSIALCAVMSACGPCATEPGLTEVCTDISASATFSEPNTTTDAGPVECPGVDALWTACGDGSTAMNGQVCNGWPCVEADSPEGADVCAQVCTYPGQDCYLQVPYCEDPMSSGQVLFGICVADEAAPDGYGACIEPCSVDADCTFPGEVCGVVDGVAACVWPTAECPAAGDLWGPCAESEDPCAEAAECVTVLGQGEVCALPCVSLEDGEHCYAQVPICGEDGNTILADGVCAGGMCMPPCPEGDCPFEGQACGAVDGVPACTWPTGPCAPPPWSSWGTCEDEGPGDPTIACASLGGSSVVGPTCPADGEPCSVTLADCETGEQVQQSGECVHGVCLRPCESHLDCPYDGMGCLPFGEVPVCAWAW